MAGVTDPLQLLAKQRYIKLSAELEVQLGNKDGGEPAVLILRILRDRAEKSLADLVTCNLHDPADVQRAIALQNEVKRYDEWFMAIKDIINAGVQADAEINEEDREALLDVLMSQGPQGERQAIALGLVDVQHDID